MWNERYAQNPYAYGKDANEFVKQNLPARPGRLLDLGAGQGRNSIHAARLGFDVTAVDSSSVGVESIDARNDTGKSIKTLHSSVEDYDLGKSQWDVILLIFLHIPRASLRDLLVRCRAALGKGGLILIEAYTGEHLANDGVGGPKDESLMYDEELVKEALEGLRLVTDHSKRVLDEGKFHQGESWTLRVIAEKLA